MATLKSNMGMWRTLGDISGRVMGAAQSYDSMISSDIARYSIMGASGLAGLWGASDPGGMYGLRGAIGAAGLAGAGMAGAGAWANGAGENAPLEIARRFMSKDFGPAMGWQGKTASGFMGGWNRGYGATQRAAGPIAGKVAKGIGYIHGAAGAEKETVSSMAAGI
jgi:hypothetical protein